MIENKGIGHFWLLDRAGNSNTDFITVPCVAAHDKKKPDGTPAEPYLYPFFLQTNAHQTVPVYKLEIVNDKQKIGAPDGTREDWLYGLHYSTSSTTLGCIKIVKEEDLTWLVGQIKAAWKDNAIVRMDVV
jgi:hypothetical protein